MPATSDREQPRRSRTTPVVAVLCVLALLAALGWSLRDRLPLPGAARCEATARDETVRFDPEQMHHAATIVQIGVARGLPARAGTIAVATAIQESKLRNITYGDRDSLGLFQQRPSQGWGDREELLDPVYATNAFYDALVKVDGWQDMRITEIAQEVQRSAYPEAYADHEHEGRAIASAIAGHSPAGLVCRLAGPERAGREDTLRSALALETGREGVLADDGTVRVSLPDETTAWGVASWAVAQAEARQVTQVQVGDRRWVRSRSGEALTWSSVADGIAPTEVRITLEQ